MKTMMKKFLAAAAAVVAAIVLGTVALAIVSPAFATTDTVVSIPWGEWVSAVAGSAREIVITAIGAAVAWVLARLPGPIAQAIRMIRVEQLLTRAVDYGITAAAGAARGQVLSVDVGNRVLAEAARYAVDAAPGLVAGMGGADRVREMLLARMAVEPDAYAATAADDGRTYLYKAR